MMSFKPIISSLLSDAPSQLCVRDLVGHCHKIAITCLRKKTKGGRFDPQFFGLPLEDLAGDCIADLFQRDPQGVFIRIASYFNAIGWHSQSDAELLAATRRLVFHTVDQAIYRLYREHDPSLGKLIRNLKNAIKSSPSFSLEKLHGDHWICLQPEDEPVTGLFRSAALLPEMPPEFLEAHLMARLRGNANLKQIVALLAEILNEQSTYRKRYPLTGLALIIRTTFVHLAEALEQESNGHANFTPEEITQMIESNVKTIRSNMQATYIGKKKKVDIRTFDTYFAAIRDLLVAEYVENDGLGRTCFDYLRSYLRELTPEDYQHKNRCHFEYLLKLTRQELLQSLKKEL